MRKYKWKKILITTLWLLAGIGTIVLLGAAMQKKEQKFCSDVKVEISGATKHMFIDEKDVLEILTANGPVTGKPIASLNLRAMEALVEKNRWVRNAEMFLDNNQVLQVRVDERQPIARVFTAEGNSFYLDSGLLRLPLSEKLSARVPVFTGFPSDKEILSKPDSLLLESVVKLGKYILADSFWMAQVAQIDITPQSGFELVPVIGDQIIAFGNAEDIDKKFRRLYTFYQKAWLQNGINTYEKIDVQYDNQVVAVRKGTAKRMLDSARASEAIMGLLNNTQVAMADSMYRTGDPKTNIPKAVKDSVSPAKSPVKEPVKSNSAPAANNKTNIKSLSNGKKPAVKKGKTEKPKAVMEKQ